MRYPLRSRRMTNSASPHALKRTSNRSPLSMILRLKNIEAGKTYKIDTPMNGQLGLYDLRNEANCPSGRVINVSPNTQSTLVCRSKYDLMKFSVSGRYCSSQLR